MPSDFDIVYPQKGRLNFSGGLNNKFDKQLIADNESADCLNVVFGTDSVETRGGSSQVNTTAVGSFVGDGLYTRHDNDGSQTMCAWWNGTLYTLAGTTFSAVASSTSVFTAGTRVAAAEYENNIFFCNGGTIPYKYNGAEFTRHGVYPPATAPTAATQGAGALTGDYRWKVTYVNSGLVESDVSTASDTFTAATEQMTVTIPTAPVSWGINQRYLYRTEAGGTEYKYVAAIANNTATTYVDNIADGSLAATAPADQGVPPVYNSVVYYKDRLFCNDVSEPNLWWYSELTNPYVFKSTNFVRAGDNTGEIVRAGFVYDDSIVIATDNQPFILYMPSTTATDWLMVKARANYGCKSPFGAFYYNNRLMFPAIQNNKIVGFAALSGAAVDPDATLLTISAVGSDLKSNRIEPDIFKIVEGYVGNITSFVFQNKAYISLTWDTGATTNNRIYVFDFSMGDLKKNQAASWAPWSGINATQFCEYGGSLYIQDSTAVGLVRKLNTDTYNDSGSAIDSYYWTKDYAGYPGHEDFHKDFRKISILYEKSGDYFMTFGYRVDSDSGVGKTQQIDLDPGGSLWGTMMWGRDVWGGGNDEGDGNLFLGQVRGKRIQFLFNNQNTADQKFKVLGLKYTYNKNGRR